MQRTVTCAGLSILVAGRAEIALLDVRRRPAFDADPGLIPGAVWKDPEQVGTWAAGLSQGQPVVAYCVHGHEVSRGVVDRLRALGVEAALLEGGIEAWKEAGGPVTPPSGGTGS
ncbi:MAG: rhodanese-like domain-containing protein [Geminicoccaceae bacterium]